MISNHRKTIMLCTLLFDKLPSTSSGRTELNRASLVYANIQKMPVRPLYCYRHLSMDIKKSGGLPPTQLESSLSVNKSGATPRLPVSTPPIAPAWQSGQILLALVQKTTPEQMLLNIQGTQASVARPPSLSVQPGDRLTLEVIKNTPQPQLKLIEIIPGATTTSNRALRANLPRQQPLPPLLANIEYLSRNPAATRQFDNAIRVASRQLYYQLPSVESLRQPSALKQALELSGVFLEHNIQTSTQAGSPKLQQDTRTSLLRLSTQLQNYIARDTQTQTNANRLPQRTPHSTLPANAQLTAESAPAMQRTISHTVSSSNAQAQAAAHASLAQSSAPKAAEQLLQQTEGALARLQIHQLHQLKGEEIGRPSWSIELPVRSEQGINLFDIRIQREDLHAHWNNEDEKASPQADSQRWSVRLAFDLPGLGPVQAVIALQQGQISVRFHTEEELTRSLFNEYRDMLGSRLRQVGLEVGGIDCQQGNPEPLEEIINSPLVDEQI